MSFGQVNADFLNDVFEMHAFRALHVSKSLNSQIPNHRSLIRQALLDCILKNQPVLSEVEKSKILDLKQIPTSNDFSISISHSKDWGGFVTAQKHYLVGMDLEDPSRMKENLLKRIKNPHDHGASSPGIWSAKESAFKALSSYINSPKFNLVDIAVHNIEDANLGDKLRGFWYKFGTPDLGPNPKNLGKGLWVESEGQILAVSLFSP